MSPSLSQMSNKGYRLIGIIVIVLVTGFILYKYIDRIMVEKRIRSENTIIFDKLRATAKLVIWEQDFKLTNVTKMEKKYFHSELFKFSEKVFTSAKGRLGFHIDLGDTVHTTFVITQKVLEIHAPLQLTYVSIDNSTIEQIKKSSIDPTLNVKKEDIVRRLNELALHEFFQSALEKARNQPLTKQEQSLSALAGRRVQIILTEMPTLESGIDWIKSN